VQSTVEALEGNKVKLSVVVDEDEFETAVDSAFKRIAREVRIPGFRPGKAPRKLLEARLGPEFAREEALREALPEYYSQAVRENAVDVIAPPDIDITDGQESGSVTFDAVVEVRPQISVTGYQDLEVEIPSPKATDEEIDAQIERLRDQFGEMATVDRAVRDGDHVSIDIAASYRGEPVEGLTADDYQYPVGSEGIVPELDAQLLGAKVGDILDFEAAHPNPEEQDRLHFRVLVKDVKEKVLPDVDDEWANEASEFDTVEELRADLAQRIGGVRSAQAAMAAREQTAAALAGLVDEDPPEAMVNAEVNDRLQDLALRLQAQGIEFEQYTQMTGRNQDEIVAELTESAQQAARVDLALRAIADAEGIEVDDDDLDTEVERLAERIGQEPAAIREQLQANEAALRSDLRKRKALEWLVDRVKLVDPDGEPIDRADLEPPDDDTDETADTEEEQDS
jgi:trigger factor